MMGTSLHTLVQMVDNGLGVTFIPAMAIEAGILDGTRVDAKPLRSDHGFRRISLIWRRSSPREAEFQMLAGALRQIIADLIRREARPPVDAQVLEIGCGTGHNLAMLAGFGHVEGLELDAEARAISEKRLGRKVMSSNILTTTARRFRRSRPSSSPPGSS
jgi:SAM-dependent methyltransferase